MRRAACGAGIKRKRRIKRKQNACGFGKDLKALVRRERHKHTERRSGGENGANKLKGIRGRESGAKKLKAAGADCPRPPQNIYARKVNCFRVLYGCV